MRRKLCSMGLFALALTGCGEDPFLLRWEADPREEVLYSLDRDELNKPSGFNIVSRITVVIEDPQAEGQWDFAVDRAGDGMVLLPPTALGVSSRAAIVALPGVEFDEVRQAPSDTLVYVGDEPVPLALGTIYVIRSREQVGGFGACVFYGKLEPIEINAVDGVFRFLQDASPDCNNRSLVPPDG